MHLHVRRNRYYRSMLTKLPYRKTAQIVFWRLWNEHWAKVLAIRYFNSFFNMLWRTLAKQSGEALSSMTFDLFNTLHAKNLKMRSTVIAKLHCKGRSPDIFMQGDKSNGSSRTV